MSRITGRTCFAIDPDALTTVVDPELVVANEFRMRSGRRRVGEDDVSHPTMYTEITGVRIGDLTISLLRVMVCENHAFDADGRRIFGVLGRDVIADSLVFGFDRDRGVAWLQTQQAFHAPADARVIPYREMYTRVLAVPRRLAHVAIDGVDRELHVDFGDAPSQLDPKLWAGAKLRETGAKLALVDETGAPREVTSLGVAERVIANGVERDRIAFAPYTDKRFYDEQMEGTLGLNFFPSARGLRRLASRTDLRAVASTGGDGTLRALGRHRVSRHVRDGELLPPEAGDPRPILRVTRTRGAGPLEIIVAADNPELDLLEINLGPGDSSSSHTSTRDTSARRWSSPT